jgi:hypothetical protein
MTDALVLVDPQRFAACVNFNLWSIGDSNHE